MAKRIFATQGAIGGLNPLGSAAATGTFMSLLIPSTSATAALCDVLEIEISGTVATSNIGGFFMVRASTLDRNGNYARQPELGWRHAAKHHRHSSADRRLYRLRHDAADTVRGHY